MGKDSQHYMFEDLDPTEPKFWLSEFESTYKDKGGKDNEPHN